MKSNNWTKADMPSQAGKTALVTGANTGIGYETALALYQAGARVVLAGRDQEKLSAAVKRIQDEGGSGSLETAVLNLASLSAIQAMAHEFIRTHDRLDILINNAGVMVPPASKTEDGYELQMGVNFLGHYVLTGHLYPLLKATPGARVVTVSSRAYQRGTIDFDNFHSERSYVPDREYAQSKLANILFALELDRRIRRKGDGVLSIAAQPGANNTELSRHMDTDQFQAAVQRVGPLMEPWQGALPQLYAATMPEVQGGEFYQPEEEVRGYPARMGLMPHALDEESASRLWVWAEQETGIVYP